MDPTAWRSRAAIVGVWVATLSTVALLPDSLNRWVLPKDVVLGIACLLAALAVPSARLPRWLLIVSGAGALVLAAGALTGAAPLAQLLGRWPRYEGAVTLLVYFAACWLGARLLGGGSASRRRAFGSAVAVASILVGVVALLEAVGLRPVPSDLERPGSLLGNATNQGIAGLMFAALLVLPVLRAIRESSRRVWLLAPGLVFALASLVLSASRAAIIAFAIMVVVAGVVWVVVQERGRMRRRALLVSLGSLVAFAAAALVVPFTRDRLLGSSPLADSSALDRIAIWSESLGVWASLPFLGAGPSGFADAVSARQSVESLTTLGSGERVDSPHNWVLQALLAGGIPLVLCALVLVVGVAIAGVRVLRAAPLSGPRAEGVLGAGFALLGFGIVLLTHFTAPATTILAAMLLGSIVAVPAASVHRVVAGLRVGLVAVWVVLLGVATSAEVSLRSALDHAQAGDLARADSDFGVAASLRPWDADVPSFAAQAFAAATVAGVAGAAPLAIDWGTTAVASAPGSLRAGEALALGQQYSGDLAGANVTLAALLELAPGNAEIAISLAGVRLQLGDSDGSLLVLERAAETAPDDLAVWRALEYVCTQVGDSAGAARAHQEVVRLQG